MTWLCDFRTKKELKEAIHNKEDFLLEDPSFVNPRTLNWSVMRHWDELDITVTNMPKRAWFARIFKNNGNIKVQ